MDAEKLNGILKGISNFGGIYDANQLERVKILSLPVMLVINSENHWIGVYLDEHDMEVMDSLGLIKNNNLNRHLCRFLCAHMQGKNFFATPQLQSNDSEDCGKYVISFLIFKAFTQKSLKEFSSVFSSNFEENSQNISTIYKTIKKLLKRLGNQQG